MSKVIVTAIDKLPSLTLHGCCEYETNFVLGIARRKFASRFTGLTSADGAALK